MSDRNNSSRRVRYIVERVKNFLSRVWSKELLTFLFFVCLSFLFWVLQSMNDESETTYRIPLRYHNVPDDVVFTETPADHITVRLRDKGIVLLDYSFRHQFEPIDIDLGVHFTGDAGSVRVREEYMTAALKRQLQAGTQLLSLSPDTLSFAYARLGDKWVPVRFDGLALPAAQFHISGDMMFEPDSVQVFATHAVLDTLRYITTRFESLKELTDTVTRSVSLVVPKGAKVLPKQVLLTVPVEEYTEKHVVLPIHVAGVPDSLQLRLFPSTADVSFFCSVSDFKDISADAFIVEVDYRGVGQQAHRSSRLALELVEMPQNVSNVRIRPDSVGYIIEEK